MNPNPSSVFIDWSRPGPVLRKTWSSVANIDQFRWLSRADVLDQLVMARDELGIRHVRACAMYSPEMRVWARPLPEWRLPREEQKPAANWLLVDISIQHLLDRGLKPVYTTCFTPAGMTSQAGACWPDRNPVGMPDDLGQWQEFVAAGLRHHVGRFGRTEMRTWYFECWNEPNLSGFFAGSQEDFFRLWAATWQAVKSVDTQFRFGGPSTARGEWVGDFLEWTRREGCEPDYLITHVYNNDSESAPLSPFDGPASHRVKDSPHFATGVVRGVRRSLDELGWKGELHWNEWGRSWFPHDPRKESPLEAAFVGKTMMEVSGEADAFAFWCLSDIYDQVGFQSSEFQGHYGLLSLHGLRKPAYVAHQLLNRLDGRTCPATSSHESLTALATDDTESAHVLVAAYPADVAQPMEQLEIEVNPTSGCTGAPTGIRIGRHENNIVAEWNQLGSPASLTPDDLAKLRERNGLSEMTPAPRQDPDGKVRFSLENPGLALLTWRKG